MRRAIGRIGLDGTLQVVFDLLVVAWPIEHAKELRLWQFHGGMFSVQIHQTDQRISVWHGNLLTTRQVGQQVVLQVLIGLRFIVALQMVKEGEK